MKLSLLISSILSLSSFASALPRHHTLPFPSGLGRRELAARNGSSTAVPKVGKDSTENDKDYKAPYFPLMGFKNYSGNPILEPNPDHDWESKYLYNPTTIVIDDKVFMLYRAQNADKTSSIGLAWSDDGTTFTRYEKPVLSPSEDYEIGNPEKGGGCEDPRVVRVNGTFYMTYSGFDGKTARLCMATSTDLVNWEKHGPILPDIRDVNFQFGSETNSYMSRAGWSKSGSILNEKQADGTYHMIFGDQFLYKATSEDLIHWNYTNADGTTDATPYAPKLTQFEQGRMEPGPSAIKTRDDKWMLMYNGQSASGSPYKYGQYSTGSLLLDPKNKPDGPPIARVEEPLLVPSSNEELEGQVPDVVFTEGLVQFHGKWYMYFGQSDTTLGVAIADVQD